MSEAVPAWDDVCWEMIMECEEPDNPNDGFKAPSSELVAKYIRLYPMWADDLIDFAATCRTQDFYAAKYPAPEPTQAELDAAWKRVMRILRAARRKAKTNG